MKIFFGTRVIQSSQWDAYLLSTIKMMRSMGLQSGDRLVLCDHNTTEYVFVLVAAISMGVIVCPVSPYWPKEAVLAYSRRVQSRHVWMNGDIKRAVSFDARQQLYVDKFQVNCSPEQVIAYLATSGSAGEPKIVVLTWGQVLANAKASQELLPFTSGDTWLLSLPVFHISGLSIIFRAFILGGALRIMTDDDLNAEVGKLRVSHISLVSTQLYRLLADPKSANALSQFKVILVGGSAISPALLSRALDLHLPIWLTYGMTETASQVATGRLVKVEEPCARILSCFELKCDQQGQIFLKGPGVFPGYLLGQKIVSAQDQEGWFATKDKGAIIDGKYLTIHGRMDHMFICSGENIHPEEVERVLLSYPGITQAIVTPWPDPERGQRPIAFILKEGNMDDDAILAFCRKHLSAIKVPFRLLTFPPQIMAQGLKPARSKLIDYASNLRF